MIINTLLINGEAHIAQKITYTNTGAKVKENVIRLFKFRSAIPDKILYESKQLPGVYLDEVEETVYTEANGRLTPVQF